MKYDSISGNVILSNGDSLDAIILAIRSQLKQADSNDKITIIYNINDIGLALESATLEDIGRSIPKESVIILDLSWSGVYAERLIPTLSNGGAGRYYSGVLFAYKHTDTLKAYFKFLSAEFEASCGFNGHDIKKLKGWRFNNEATISMMPMPKDFNNMIRNIYLPGNYFFTSDVIAIFIDKPPTTRAGYLTVINSTRDKDGDKKFIFTENHPDARSWTRISYSNEWVSSPSVHLMAVPDDRLRIGDMKINSAGNLIIRTNSSTVKEI